MADTNVFSQAVKGGNNPTQDTSTLRGFYEAPNPLFRAMNQNTVTDISVLSDGKVGSFLQRRSIVNGDIATIIDASARYFFGDKVKNLPPINPNLKNTTSTRTFIPIVIKTDFKFQLDHGKADKKPLYIIFDSTPESIIISKTANWQQKDFLGRPEPIFTYSNSGPSSFNLTGKFFAESFSAHGRLLKVSEYIMALATPSELNYMPSPVTVFIGEWKALRCLVNNVSIKYTGPWAIPVDETDINNSDTQQEAMTRIDAVDRQNSSKSIPSHAPYFFEATFNFTIVGQDNHVKYAEQLVIANPKNTSGNTTDTLLQNGVASADLQSALAETAEFDSRNIKVIPVTDPTISGLYSLVDNTSYTYSGSKISNTIKSDLNYADGVSNMNIYDNANNIRRSSDQGIISNAVSSQMLSLFQKANPTSTNTPKTSSSLNPFRKLF